jgi:hypothetical protein
MASAYSPLATSPQFAGEWNDNSGLAELVEESEFVRSESMEIKNDPRFFQDNVLNKRIKAFAAVAVVATLMVKSSMKAIYTMDKDMQLFTQQGGSHWHFNGLVQLLAFTMLIVVFVSNMIAAYVGVAQPYHTIRLMTAGPTGFEAAASYYLNRNIIAWRHMSIKYMLLSIPLYISQMGFRLIVKFDRETKVPLSKPLEVPLNSRIEGGVFAFIVAISALVLYQVHSKHFAVFRDRYDSMARNVQGDTAKYLFNLNRDRKPGQNLDV